jgi:hypothetical protein
MEASITRRKTKGNLRRENKKLNERETKVRYGKT